MTKEEAKGRIEKILAYMESLDADEEEVKDIDALNTAIKALEKRKTGRWILNCGGADCYCSLCKVSPLSYTDACGLDGGSIMVESMEFCPCCGAKMKGEEE